MTAIRSPERGLVNVAESATRATSESMWKKSTPGRGNNQCNNPEVGAYLQVLETGGISVWGAEGAGGEHQRR